MTPTRLKISLVQSNPTVGGIESNAEYVLVKSNEAERKRSDLIIFPEMFLSGYQPLDLVNRRFFLENIDRVFSRDQLLNHVWKNDALVEPRTVDVHVRRLRKVLNTNNKKDYIRTVRSAGYSFGHN